jgi:hypothetical protein
MSARVQCNWCLQTVPADGVHSCFDAKKVADHRDAERAVIEAAVEHIGTIKENTPHESGCRFFRRMRPVDCSCAARKGALAIAVIMERVEALRALEAA